MEFFKTKTNFPFMGTRRRWYVISAIAIVAALTSFAFRGLNLGIDFTGGVVIDAHKIEGAPDVAGLRDKLGNGDFGEVIIQGFNEADVSIRVKPSAAMTGQEQKVAQMVRDALGPDYEVRRTDTVGPKVSDELFTNGVIACLLSVLMIAIYVAFRFEWQFGVAAFIATFHDVLITAGLFSVTRMDFNLNAVAALLTLAGYSINDTVVIFDRIRENRRKYKKMPIAELINLSTNQTLSRTVMTSVCTAISVIPIVLFGGEALFGFSVAILFGIAVGTYSSIYVASALLLYMPPIGAMEPAAAKPADARP